MNQPAYDRPDLPAPVNPFAVKLAAVEAELDRLHPRWRKGAPYDHLPVDTLRAVKVALKRASRLRKGVDAEVDLITPDPKKPQRCFAISREVTDGIVAQVVRSADAPVPFVAPDPSLLAFDLRLPLERVEAALARMPDAYRRDGGPAEWVRLYDSIAA